MKILFFQAYYSPENTATTYITDDLIQGMIDNGHQVELFVPTPTRGITREIRDEYRKKKYRYEVKNNGKLIIHRIGLYDEPKGTIGRMIRYLLMNMLFILKSLSIKADVIFCESTPPTQGAMAAIIKQIKKIPFIYNLQDVFPDSLITTGIGKRNSIAWKVGRRIEDFSYRYSDSIITISNEFEENIIAKGVDPQKITVVNNWADTDEIVPVDRKENVLFDRFNLDRNGFYVVYSGNIGLTQNMELLIRVAEDMTDVDFVVIGDGVAREDTQNKTKHLKNFHMFPYQPYEDISMVFSLGDAGLVISKPEVGNSCVPSKTWGIMAAGRPVIASFDLESSLVAMINRVGCGVVAAAGDREALIRAIRNIRPEMGIVGRDYVLRELNREKCVGKYMDVFSLYE